MTEHNVGLPGAVALVVTMTCAKVFLGLPREMVIRGGTAAWLVVLIAMVHGPLLWWAVRGVLRLQQGRSLVTATEAILGPAVGTVLNLAYFGFFFFLASTVLREFSEGEVLIFLPITPLPVVLLSLLGCALYIAYLGLEAAARTAWLGGPWMLIGYVLLMLASLKTHTEPHALAPFWGTGIAQVASWGLVENLLGDMLIFGVIAPSFRDPKQLDRAVWWTIVLCSLILVGTEMVYQYVFPYPAAKRIILPLIQATRTISLGPGVQRVESVFFVIWIVGGVLKMAAALYAAASVLAQTLRLPNYRPLFVPLGMLAYSMALLPENVTAVVGWDTALRQYGGLVTMLLPAMTWGIGRFLRKRGGRNAAG